ncbi:MAG: hypothetical protein M3069_09860 [Chloroflexota bacterium]|nr:hypothetical protein [Chloroflexota bacterium]
MPTAAIVGALNGISQGLLLIGGAVLVLTLAMAGLCMMFSWMDTHIGGFIKRVFLSAVGGATLLGGSGALGLWLSGLFGL